MSTSWGSRRYLPISPFKKSRRLPRWNTQWSIIKARQAHTPHTHNLGEIYSRCDLTEWGGGIKPHQMKWYILTEPASCFKEYERHSAKEIFRMQEWTRRPQKEHRRPCIAWCILNIKLFPGMMSLVFSRETLQKVLLCHLKIFGQKTVFYFSRNGKRGDFLNSSKPLNGIEFFMRNQAIQL